MKEITEEHIQEILNEAIEKINYRSADAINHVSACRVGNKLSCGERSKDFLNAAYIVSKYSIPFAEELNRIGIYLIDNGI